MRVGFGFCETAQQALQVRGVCGKNCYEVVMDRILSLAEYLLLGTDMEGKAIGFGPGFSSGGELCDVFCKVKGDRTASASKGYTNQGLH